VSECKPLAEGNPHIVDPAVVKASMLGRGLHWSTFQLNLSRFGHTSACPHA